MVTEDYRVGLVAIGVDLGGTNLRTSILTRDGNILEKHKEATRAAEGCEKVVARLVQNINRQVAVARRSGHDVAAIGVGAPGVIHTQSGVVVKSPNFPDWNNLQLKAILQKALGISVYIENDANAAALGEQWRGAGRDAHSMVFITLGTGVGGGIVLKNKIWHGADGMAGEVGHMTLIPNGRTCGCGNRGCLEMYASARGIIQSYRELVPDAPQRMTSEQVFHAAREGDGTALRVMREMGAYLGIGIANLVNILNPQLVVIGGGVKDGWPLFIDAAVAEMKKRAFDYPAERTKVLPSVLGDDAGMVGAAAAAFQNMDNR